MKYLSFLFLIGCVPSMNLSKWDEGSNVNVFIDDPNHEFSQSEIDVIHESFSEWEYALDGHITIRYVSSKGYRSMIIVRPDTKQHLLDTRDKVGVTDFVFWERGGAITVPYDVDEDYLKKVILHEIGHGLGLDHDGPGTIMASSVKWNAGYVTCEDVWSFCDQNDCDWEEMPPCEEFENE